MLQSVTEIKMDDFAIAAPAALTILATPLSFSIAEGIGLGLICTAALALPTGRARLMTPVGCAIAVVFFFEFFHIFPFNG